MIIARALALPHSTACLVLQEEVMLVVLSQLHLGLHYFLLQISKVLLSLGQRTQRDWVIVERVIAERLDVRDLVLVDGVSSLGHFSLVTRLSNFLPA
jgi:hypothetical protein